MKIIILILSLSAVSAFALFFNGTAADKKMDAKMQELLDEREIISVVNSIGI